MTRGRISVVFIVLAIAFLAIFAPASARTQSITHGGTYWGTNVEVGPNQEIDGDVTVYGGDAIVDGGTVRGNVTSYGGTVMTENGGDIEGQVSENDWSSWMPFAAGSTIAAENRHLMTRLAYSLIVVLAFLIFPLRVRKALDRVEHHPGLSAATGVLALIAVLPVAFILLVSVIGIPLIPVEFIAIFAGILIGQAALGVLIGRRLYELVRPHGTPSPLGALVLGLVVLSAAEILPVVGGLLTGLVCLVGLGAAILAFIRETTFMGAGAPGEPSPAGAGPGSRPPIGGPPMTQV